MNFTFDRTRLLPLHFADGDISFDDIKTRADRYNLPIAYSHTIYLQDKDGNQSAGSQVVFLNDVPITDAKIVEIAVRTLKVIFPESLRDYSEDTSGAVPGDTMLRYFDQSIPEINLEALMRNMSLYLKDKRGDTHYKKSLLRWSDLTGVRLTEDHFPDISIVEGLSTEEISSRSDSDLNGKISPKSTISLHRSGENLPDLYYLINLKDHQDNNSISSSAIDQKPKLHLPYRSDFLNDIRSRCRLFSEFESNVRKLDDDELFGLAANLNKIESGAKRFRQILESH